LTKNVVLLNAKHRENAVERGARCAEERDVRVTARLHGVTANGSQHQQGEGEEWKKHGVRIHYQREEGSRKGAGPNGKLQVELRYLEMVVVEESKIAAE
jgi:hypothetical protein